jgi:hypothetical protein
MEVKGSAIITVPLFVRKKFALGFDAWMGSLPSEAQKIMAMPLASRWYPLGPGLVVPTQRICDQFYGGDDEGAWEAGKFSADQALGGMYRLFIQFGTPAFLVGRSVRVFETYFRPCRVVVAEAQSNRAVLHIQEFPEPSHLVECRIASWMKRGLELSGCKSVTATITKSLATGDSLTEIVQEWK